MIKLYNGDCLVESDKIDDDSVDLILTDLPYGNMKNAPSTWDKEKTYWDTAIDPKKIYDIANRILRKNGKMILFSQEPYTTKLINESTTNIPFSYRAIWEKDTFANALGVNKAMVGFYEDILIFSKYEEDRKGHVLQQYFYDEFKKCGLTMKEICQQLETTNASHFFTKGKQFRVPNEVYLKKLQDLTGEFNITYEEVANAQQSFYERNRELYPSVFNLWEGNKYKSNILKYKKDYDGHHTTQKPVLLLEDLIKTFSNEGDMVVDLTMGSGSTGVACVNTYRNFIGIELDEKYFSIAKKRTSEQISKIQMTI